MRMLRVLLSVATACCCGVCETKADAGDACGLDDGSRIGVTRAVDGETLVLDDGRTLRLVGALAPAADEHGGSQAREAARFLETLVAGRSLTLRTEGRRSDRYGRILAQAFLVPLDEGDKEVWVQERLVRNGMARAYALPGNSGCLAPLLAAEQEARREGRGLWHDTRSRVRSADDTAALITLMGQFAIVTGRVAAVAHTRHTVFINFGADWRRDFTATLPGRIATDNDALASRLSELEGKSVRVRGWIERRNGPMIALGSVDEIEVMEEGEAAP